jgi:hypothetical protein
LELEVRLELQVPKAGLVVIRYFPQLLLLVEVVAVSEAEVAQITTETMAVRVVAVRLVTQ